METMYNSTQTSETRIKDMSQLDHSHDMANIEDQIEDQIEDCKYSLQLISLLFQYPTSEWALIDELYESVNEISNESVRSSLIQFLNEVQALSVDEWAELYVRTFDFNSNNSLYLTYSAMGEERERGQILVQLKALYEQAGFEMTSGELPDYLPLFLEFVAAVPMAMGRETLAKYQPAINQLETELAKTDTPYKPLMRACVLATEQFLGA